MSADLRIGNWSIGTVPAGWELVPDGLRRSVENVFPSNVVFTEEPLPVGMTPERYVENQIQVMQHLLHEPKIVGPRAISAFGSEQSQTLQVSYQSSQGHPVLQTQTYTVAGERVGIVTFTTLETERAEVEDHFKMIARGLRFTSG